jgi:hypothetical protein
MPAGIAKVCMEKPESNTHSWMQHQYFVRRNVDGDWHVVDKEIDRPLARFAIGDDARDFALAIAKDNPGSCVRIYGESGQLVTTAIL